jgi:hypothetical protein
MQIATYITIGVVILVIVVVVAWVIISRRRYILLSTRSTTTAKVSPPWSRYPASNLINGQVGGFTFAKSNYDSRITGEGSSTTAPEQVWAEVDLGKPAAINEVVIYNRKDCCQNLFGIFTLSIDGDVILSDNGSGRLKMAITLPKLVEGRVVRITYRNPGKNILNLNQIQVFGRWI